MPPGGFELVPIGSYLTTSRELYRMSYSRIKLKAVRHYVRRSYFEENKNQHDWRLKFYLLIFALVETKSLNITGMVVLPMFLIFLNL